MAMPLGKAARWGCVHITVQGRIRIGGFANSTTGLGDTSEGNSIQLNYSCQIEPAAANALRTHWTSATSPVLARIMMNLKANRHIFAADDD